ncbi:iron complex outermembrane recepter protein [Lishizhenia tianjinensis]|uniref:Iron complex outermembrane recepter protein n=1 Tax=Lishizhenia tianjinensis TaxID=477690 RepID=A0A1I7AHJ8_9FLAO|nr:TonB-dependent receptor [Lishizhenia tianjinensis]SFT74419.1 iron complex outermembrane recepter protein [Lishizhenia tianjinensis]
MKAYSILLLFLFFGGIVNGQTIEGRVVDAQTQLPIAFAKVFVLELERGVVTDSAGHFSFSDDFNSTLSLRVSALSYSQQLVSVQPQENKPLNIALQPEHLSFDEVSIQSTLGEVAQYNIVEVERREIAALNEIASTDLVDALAKIPGVNQSKLGAGISKPVVRGLMGSRVLTYLNGLRIENQQWGGDHGLGIDQLGIGAVEVIKGPASLLYGADALGGVIYLIDENYAAHNTVEVMTNTAFESNNLMTKNQLGLKYGGEKLRFNFYANYNNAADYQIPGGDYIKNSRFYNRNIKFSTGYNTKKWVGNLRYNYSNARYGIPGHTHDSLVTYQDFISQETSRVMALPAQVINNHYLLFDNAFYFKKSTLKVKLGQSLNHLQEYEEKFTIPALSMQLKTSSLNANYSFKWRKMNWVWGTQALYQTNSNNPAASERILPNATQQDFGLFALVKGKVKGIDYQIGARGDIRNLRTHGDSSINKSFESFNYSAGIAKQWQKLVLRLNVSTGFRAPHSSELLANGVHHGSLSYELGDLNLVSEKAQQIDASVAVKGKHIELNLVPFYNRIKDFIYSQPTGEMVDNFPLYRYQQAQRVDMYGTDVQVHFHPHAVHDLHIISSFSYLRASFSNQEALPLQPQNKLNLMASYSFFSKRKLSLSKFVVNFDQFLAQNRPGVTELATPAFLLVDMALHFKVKTKQDLQFQCGVRNLLNESYVPHLSKLKNYNIPSQGRNVYLSITLNLKYNTHEK